MDLLNEYIDHFARRGHTRRGAVLLAVLSVTAELAGMGLVLAIPAVAVYAVYLLAIN